MSLEEKVNFIEEWKSKTCLLLSPGLIKRVDSVVYNYDSYQLYDNMDSNTYKVAEREIVSLFLDASDGSVASRFLTFDLVFCGKYIDLKKYMENFLDFINDNSEDIIAVYKCPIGCEKKGLFSKTKGDYRYVYLSLSKLFSEFDNSRVNYELDIDSCKKNDDFSTKFVISYDPKKCYDDLKGYQKKKSVI